MQNTAREHYRRLSKSQLFQPIPPQLSFFRLYCCCIAIIRSIVLFFTAAWLISLLVIRMNLPLPCNLLLFRLCKLFRMFMLLTFESHALLFFVSSVMVSLRDVSRNRLFGDNCVWANQKRCAVSIQQSLNHVTYDNKSQQMLSSELYSLGMMPSTELSK